MSKRRVGRQQRDARIVAFVPARGGSKSIPSKNIAPIAGRPLIHWVLSACSKSRFVTDTFVATDSFEIRGCVEALGLPRVTVIDRSPETSTDDAPTDLALVEFAKKHTFDHVLLVQPTSPLLTSQHIDGAMSLFLDKRADSLLTVVRTKRFMWSERDGLVSPCNYDPSRRPRRQDWHGQLVENGALYITSRHRIVESRCRISGSIIAYEMPAESYFELDEPTDWTIIEQFLRLRQRDDDGVRLAARAVRLLCVDVDGTLTDGGMYYAEKGELLKRFHTRDAMGLQLLMKSGVSVALISSENSQIIQSRAAKMNIKDVHLGMTDKRAFLEGELHGRALRWNEVGYVGDDINDRGVMTRVGFSACPADAVGAIRDCAMFVCRKRGGHGAVREVCEYILLARNAT